MGKVWRFGGKEDNFIEKLIETGRITKNTQASELKQSYPTMFKAFSDNVIKNHLNELKRRKNFTCKKFKFHIVDTGSTKNMS